MEIIMLGFFKYCGMAVSFVAMLTLAGPPDALAQKKLTYEQAWAACIKEVKSSTYSNESAETNQRYTRAIVCMGRYGYRI
jgi:hypothetical protein